MDPTANHRTVGNHLQRPRAKSELVLSDTRTEDRRSQEATLEEIVAERIARKVVEKATEILASSEQPICWLTVEEAAEHIRRDYREVYKLVRDKEIPSHRAGPRCIRISRAELDEWLLSQ